MEGSNDTGSALVITKKKAPYISRKKLLREILSKEVSTQKFLLKQLKAELARPISPKPFYQLAKQMGVKIVSIKISR